MPSSATRSGRLVRGNQSDKEETKDEVTKTKSVTRKSSGNKTPEPSKKTLEDSLEKTKRSKQQTSPDATPKTSKKDSKKISDQESSATPLSEKSDARILSPDLSLEKDQELMEVDVKKTTSPATPSSSVRRSRRAPVPSSRFKDMEMTPNAQRTKRPLAKSPSASEYSDGVSDPSPKRSRKNSAKLSEVPSDKECPLPSPVFENKDVDNPAKPESHSATVEEQAQCVEEETKDVIAEAASVSKKDESCHGEDREAISKKSVDGTTQSKSEDRVEAEDTENLVNDMEEEVAEGSLSEDNKCDDDLEKSNAEAVMVLLDIGNEGKTTKVSVSDTSTTLLSPELPVSSSAVTMEEATPEEVSVEEVGLSCHDGGIIVEETVHTCMDEKDVVIQNQEVTETVSVIEQNIDIHTPKEIELSTPDEAASAAISSGILMKGQEVTVQERDGKMVAIVKIPPNLGSHFTSSLSSNAQSDSVSEDQFPMLSSLKNITLNAPPSQKNRHGYILNKNKKGEEQQFVTVSDQDQGKFLNISLEPTTISSLLKPKPETSPTKSTPKSLYGRVIKQDSAGPKAVETAIPVQNTPATNVIIKKTSSNQKISLLSHPIKGTSSKDNKPYSLLSSPSDLLQKLKAESEKKIALEQKKSTPATKVVIIAHPSKSEGQQGEKSSDKEKEVEGATVESMDQLLTVESTASVVEETETKLEIETQQEVLPQIATIEAIEDIATGPEFVADSSKGEGEIVIPSIFPENENVENNVVIEKKTVDSSDEKKDLSDAKSGEVVVGVSGDGISITEQTDELKESLMETEESSYPEPAKTGDDDEDVKDVLMLQEDKSTAEETVITSSVPSELQIKSELGLETAEFSGGDKTVELLALDEKGKTTEGGSPKTQKIKLVDNGVVYELQIVSDGENRPFNADTLELEGVDGESSMVVKQEIVDDEENASSETAGKSTLGTQTIYTSKRGRPKATGDNEDADSPVHKLATIVQEGGQKKHYYYVSVVPGKTIVGKYRRSVDHSLPGCVVNEVGEYCCKECDYKTDKKANFYKHRRLHTGSKPHVCQVCKYQARTSSNLKRHMGIHEDIREFKCNQCSLSFRQKIHLERHIRYRHEEKRVKCPMCDYVCANEQPDLKMHIKRKHTHESGKVFTCPQCNIEVGSKRDLKQHLKFHKEGPELKLFCKECSFVTDCKSRLQRHLVVHSNVKPYHCGVCDYKATQKEHVVRHLRSQHKIEVNKPKRPWKKQLKQEMGETLGGNSRGDFTCGDKIFACNHCTMRFAKLINLYKHLHTQHSDIMPAETDNNYYCVVCEFSTSSKKNLLVHMRRHNMTDQTPPTHVYSCVLCRYVNPRRRNLFQHMRKKHNIDISTQVDIAGMTEEEEAAVRQDGDKMAEFIHTDHSVFTQAASSEDIATSSSFDNADGTQVVKDSLAGVANMIKIEDLTRVTAAGGPDLKDSAGLVIDNSDGTTHVLQASSLMHTKAADAIEGLQALAGQAGLVIDEEVSSSMDKQPTIVIEQAEGGEIITTNADGTLSDGSIILSANQAAGIVDEQMAIEEANSDQIQHIVESVEATEGGGAGMTSLELTEEQLSSLHHGDIVQMDSQVFMVEIAQDPDSPDKQLLSFLPINQG